MDRGQRSLNLRALGALCGVALAGCAQQAGANTSSQAWWAKINKAVFTADDVAAEFQLSAPPPQAPEARARWQQEFTEQFVTQELLVQEAQRRGLHRDPAFMRVVERFWKQALLQALLESQGRQITSRTDVYDHEIEAQYGRMRQETRARIVVCADRDTAERLRREPADASLAAQPGVQELPWEWVKAGMLDPTLEQAVETTAVKAWTAPLEQRGQWVIVAVAERREVNIPPLEHVRDEIVRTLRRRKAEQAFSAWYDTLRAAARVEINPAAFEDALSHHEQ